MPPAVETDGLPHFVEGRLFNVDLTVFQRIRRHNEKVDVVFRVTEFDFRLEGYAQMLAHLPHNIRETIIGEIAVKVE